jgi:hypothetical protein
MSEGGEASQRTKNGNELPERNERGKLDLQVREGLAGLLLVTTWPIFLKERMTTEKRYRFPFTKYKGKTMEEVILLDPSWLYRLVIVAEKQSLYPEMLSYFEKLQKRLMYARSREKCYHAGCKRRAKWLTLAHSYGPDWLPNPYYWCDKHEPQETEGISEKMRIHFDVIRELKNKGAQKEMGALIRHALRIPEGCRITEEFAIFCFDEWLSVKLREEQR